MTEFTVLWFEMKLFFFFVFVVAVSANSDSHKYSEKANMKSHMRENKKPFRMAKLNIVWQKALMKLSDAKLKSLMEDLKLQDKEELILKKLKAEGGDKGGLKEAELRKRLRALMHMYKLSSIDDDTLDPYKNEVGDEKIHKAIFKDKKLHKLWRKAEESGFSEEELKTLKVEFQHHQEKVDEYYNLINSQGAEAERAKNDLKNDISQIDLFSELESSDKYESSSTNAIREKHRDLKRGYDKLHKLATSGSLSKEFSEPKVAGLWRLALQSDFNDSELESLHTELRHYENRIMKVRYLSGELDVLKDKTLDQEKLQTSEGRRVLEERLQKQKRTVEKMHEDLETRILQRHSEL